MSKKVMPEWIKASRAYLLLIQAAEASFNEDCTCRCCQLMREWAETAPQPPRPAEMEAGPYGRKRTP